MKNAIYIGLAFIVVIKLGLFVNPLSKSPEFVAQYDGSEVILYATSWCGYCEKTRKLLEKNNIPYTEYDVETSEKGREEYDQLGARGVPVLLINGKVIRGYNPKKILNLAKEA